MVLTCAMLFHEHSENIKLNFFFFDEILFGAFPTSFHSILTCAMLP